MKLFKIIIPQSCEGVVFPNLNGASGVQLPQSQKMPFNPFMQKVNFKSPLERDGLRVQLRGGRGVFIEKRQNLKSTFRRRASERDNCVDSKQDFKFSSTNRYESTFVNRRMLKQSVLPLLQSTFCFFNNPPLHASGEGTPQLPSATFAYSPRPLRLQFLILLMLFPLIGLAQQRKVAQNIESEFTYKKEANSVIPLTPSSEAVPLAKGGQNTLDQYLQEAAQNNPGLKAQFHEYLAALQQVPQVTALPDPEAAFGYFIRSTETRVGPQQARFGITQMFPWFGTLGARGNAATQMAKAKFEAFREVRNTLFFKVKKTWYELYHIDTSIRITGENIDILETFESLVTRRYETAQAGQIDILRVQIEKEDLKTRLTLLKDSKNVLQQKLNDLLNRPEELKAHVPDTLAATPLPLTIPALKQLTLKQNPRLTKLDYEAASARSNVKVAQKEGLPGFGLGLDYIITGEGPLAAPDNGKDAIIGRVGVRIPLYRKKYRAKKRQATLQLQAVQDRQLATENKLITTLKETLRDFYDAQRRVSLYKNIQIQRTRQALDILTEKYANSTTDFEELLRLQRKLLEFQLAREKAVVDQNTAVAFVEYLYGKYNVNPEEIEISRE